MFARPVENPLKSHFLPAYDPLRSPERHVDETLGARMPNLKTARANIAGVARRMEESNRYEPECNKENKRQYLEQFQASAPPPIFITAEHGSTYHGEIGCRP